MPQVPTLNTFDVQPTSLPSVSFQSPESAVKMAATFGQGIDDNQTLATGATNLNNDAMDIQQRMNVARTTDGTNQARQAALDAQYGTRDAQGNIITPGYESFKGIDALQRSSGQPLAVEYGQQLQSKIGDIYNSLGNDAQKAAFSEQAKQIQTSFEQGVQQHVATQAQTYQQSVAQGAIDIATNSAALNWNDPASVDQAVTDAKNGVMLKLQGQPGTGEGGQGQSANMVVATQQATESAIRSKVIDTALENNNPTYAMSYFNQYKGAMTGDDILKVQGKINQQVDQHIALAAVNAATQTNLHILAPTPSDRAYNLATGGNAFQVAIGTESNGQQFAADGVTPLTSSKGAIGIAQVMPATGPDAAKMAGLPWDENKFKNDGNYNYKLGEAYFNAQVKQFGGADKAFAAYDAGPGALQKALDQSQADGKPAMWLTYLPQETQKYVTKNVNLLQMGGGSPVPMTKVQYVQQALSQDFVNQDRPQQIALIRDQAEKQFDLLQSSRTENGQNAVAEVQRSLDQNGGDMTAITPAQLSAVTQYAPDKVASLYTYAKSIANPAMTTNGVAYSNAVAHPEQLAQMSNDDFQNYLKTNFAPGRDQDRISTLRGDALSGNTNNSSQSINAKALTDTLNNRMTAMGLTTGAKSGTPDAQQIAYVRKYVTDDIYSQQQQLGRKMTPEELTKRVDNLFSNSSITTHWYGNTNVGLASKVSDIPSTNLSAIKAAYVQRGVAAPSDEQLLDLYWRGQQK